MRGGETVTQQPHKLSTAGSNPVSATICPWGGKTIKCLSFWGLQFLRAGRMPGVVYMLTLTPHHLSAH